jgi:hypothetical protein
VKGEGREGVEMIMEKCRNCFTRSGKDEKVCPVCKIEKAKSKKELTRSEKLTRYFCRGIRVVGLLKVIEGIGLVIFAWTGIVKYRATAMFTSESIPILFFILYALFLFVFGYGLMKYKKWAFYMGIIYFPIRIISPFITFRSSCYIDCSFDIKAYPVILGLFQLLLFYYVVNATSRKILLRPQPSIAATPCA